MRFIRATSPGDTRWPSTPRRTKELARWTCDLIRSRGSETSRESWFVFTSTLLTWQHHYGTLRDKHNIQIFCSTTVHFAIRRTQFSYRQFGSAIKSILIGRSVQPFTGTNNAYRRFLLAQLLLNVSCVIILQFTFPPSGLLVVSGHSVVSAGLFSHEAGAEVELICWLATRKLSPYCRTVSVHPSVHLCVCPRQLESSVCTQHCASRATSTTGLYSCDIATSELCEYDQQRATNHI